MNFLFNVMRSTVMVSKTVSALGATLVISYGIYQFVKERREERKVSKHRKIDS